MIELQDINCLHDFKKSNGFEVCVKCGYCIEIDYFISDAKELELRYKKGNSELTKTPYKTRTYNTSKQYNRLMRIDRSSKYTISGYLALKIRLLTNRIGSYLNDKQKIVLERYIWNKKPKSVIDVFQHIFYCIDSLDFPILTHQVIDIIKQDTFLRTRLKLFRDITRYKKVREYYWYISKRISEIKSLPNSMSFLVFSSVKSYYRLVRFRLHSSSNPKNLINYLLYEMINQHFKFIPKEERTLEKMNITHFFKRDNKLKLKKIKELNLDEKIPLKLNLVWRKKRENKNDS